MTSRIYSVGYAGMDVESLVDLLASLEISLVIDVRLTPMSRRRGYSKAALADALCRGGIRYRHEPELGNPPWNRSAFARKDVSEARLHMRQLLEHREGGALRRMIDDAHHRVLAVLCVEREDDRCHRSVITDMVHDLDPTIEIVRLSHAQNDGAGK